MSEPDAPRPIDPPRARRPRGVRGWALRGAIAAALFVALCLAVPALWPRPRWRPPESVPPAMLVHGFMSSGSDLSDLGDYLRRRGVGTVDAVDLRPADASVAVRVLAEQLAQGVAAQRARTGASRVDVVGYSLGALVARYWIQRLDGKAHARRFVSISGPHHGVPGGYLSSLPGARELRPGSALLRELDADADPWGPVQVYDFYTPLDLVILPASTAQLPSTRATESFVVGTHHHMIHDPRVLDAVARALLDP